MSVEEIANSLPQSTINKYHLDTLEKRIEYVKQHILISYICSEDILQQLSYRIGLNKSTNKLAVTPSILEIVASDSIEYQSYIKSTGLLTNVDYRIKTISSIRGKVKRYPDKSFQSVFNDILGIRIKVASYITDIPEYLRYVDLRNGKSIDDGYRAQHFYYKLDNYHYIIEIQVWDNKDFEFNKWSHTHAYKRADNSKLLKLRDMYDNHIITTEEQFVRYLHE